MKNEIFLSIIIEKYTAYVHTYKKIGNPSEL